MRNIAALNKHITNLLAQAEQRTGRNQSERAVIYLPIKDDQDVTAASEQGYGAYKVVFYVPEHREGDQHEPTEPTETDSRYIC